MPDEKDPAAMSAEEVLQAARALWTRYLALTQELLKFLAQEDIETFTEIVEQRAKLIDKIDELPTQDYTKLDEFQAIAEKIKPLDREIMYKARAWLNKSRRQNSMVRSYDLGTSLAMTRANFNRRY